MEGKENASTLKSIKRNVNKTVNEVLFPPTRETFNPEEWGGYSYDDLTFDAEKRIENNPRLKKRLKETNKENQLKIISTLKENWEMEAQTEVIMGKQNPIRLLPVGTDVIIGTYNNKERWGKVGTPVIDGNETIGRYRDIVGEWDYVTPNTPFKIGRMITGKKVSPRWDKDNKNAEKLKFYRNKFKSLNE